MGRKRRFSASVTGKQWRQPPQRKQSFSLSAYELHSWPLWPQTLHWARAILRPVSQLRLSSSGPITHLTDTMGKILVDVALNLQHSSTDAHLTATSGLQFLTQGPRIDLGKVYEPQNFNLLLEKWSKAFIRFSKVSLIPKRLNPLYKRVMIKTKNKNLNSEVLGTPRRLNSKLPRCRPCIHHWVSGTQ